MLTSIYAKIALALAALLVLVAIVVGVRKWDQDRLQAEYQRGEQAERGKWQAEQERASREQAAKNQADTRASEAAADTAREGAAAAIAENAAVAATATEEITRAHVEAQTPVCRPGPDGRARRLPDGVLQGLNRARSSAVGEAGAAAR